MATKKVRIPKESLPALGIVNSAYDVRYRIISEDRNRLSAWSPIYHLERDFVDFADTVFSAPTVTGTTVKNVSIGWLPPEGLPATSYDVYVKTGLISESIEILDGLIIINFASSHNLDSGESILVSGLGSPYDGVHTIQQSIKTGTPLIKYVTTAADQAEQTTSAGRVVRNSNNSGYVYNSTVPGPYYQVSVDGTIYDFIQLTVQLPTVTKNIDSKALLQTSSEILI